MTFSDYQQWVKGLLNGTYKTDKAPLVAALGLAGEAGEVANDVKKEAYGRFTHDETKAKVKEELGDCAFYMAALATAYGLSLGEIYEENVEKLEARLAKKHQNMSGSNRELANVL